MATRGPRGELQKRAWSAMVGYAFFRPESALTIGLIIVLTAVFRHPFEWWPAWGWLAVGGVAEVIIIVSSLTDQMTGQRVVADMFRQKYNSRSLASPELRARAEKALDYWSQIERALKAAPAGVLRDHMADTVSGITGWIDSIFRLALRVDAYRGDGLVQKDLAGLPGSMKDLATRLACEDDVSVREQIQTTIEQKQEQLANLEKLQNIMEKADYQLETTLTAMGTVYSQVLLIGTQDIEGSRAQRLKQDIAEQVASLQDILSSMDEVVRHGKGV
jgi:hypothetical protein